MGSILGSPYFGKLPFKAGHPNVGSPEMEFQFCPRGNLSYNLLEGSWVVVNGKLIWEYCESIFLKALVAPPVFAYDSSSMGSAIVVWVNGKLSSVV